MKKKFIVIAMIVSWGLFGLFLLTTFAAKKGGTDQIMNSAMVLTSLAQKGLIQIISGDISVFVLVEPLWWKGLSHRGKVAVVSAVITVARNEKKKPDFIIVQDMTERETLAKGFVDSGQIKISK